MEFEPTTAVVRFDRSAYMKQWHQENRERRRANQKKRRLDRLGWINELKQESGCLRCPEDDPACLEFHHLDGSEKSFAISEALRDDYSRERILAEITKCVILCANCHRKEHKSMVMV